MQDFLNIRAIGNTGDEGYETLSAECTSKNAMCIGASMSAAASILDAANYTDYDGVIDELNYEFCVEKPPDAANLSIVCDANNETTIDIPYCCSNKTFQLACCPSYINVRTTFPLSPLASFSPPQLIAQCRTSRSKTRSNLTSMISCIFLAEVQQSIPGWNRIWWVPELMSSPLVQF